MSLGDRLVGEPLNLRGEVLSDLMHDAEVWFGIIERQAIHRGTFRSVRKLMIKISAFIDGWTTAASRSSGPRPPMGSSRKPTVARLQLRIASHARPTE
jgi:hypothetical protein